MSEVKNMKFGEMKYDVPFEKLKSAASGEFDFFEKLRIQQEGKRLYKSHPEYSYLKEDPWIKDDSDFYKSVTYAYMVDQILKKTPEHKEEYKNQIEKFIKGWARGTKDINTTAAQAYSWYNRGFIHWYQNYLREQADPGCLERERQKEKEEIQKSIELHAAVAKRDEERHPHIECPYCHSTNTEKITTLNRSISVSLVGAASSKLGKQWHCKNCNSNF